MLEFILCSYGLTQILTVGSIFDSIRPKHKFFHCPMCVGFWVGIFLLCIIPYTQLFNFDLNLANAFLLGCLSSGTSYILHVLFDDWGLNIIYVYKHNFEESKK